MTFAAANSLTPFTKSNDNFHGSSIWSLMILGISLAKIFKLFAHVWWDVLNFFWSVWCKRLELELSKWLPSKSLKHLVILLDFNYFGYPNDDSFISNGFSSVGRVMAGDRKVAGSIHKFPISPTQFTRCDGLVQLHSTHYRPNRKRGALLCRGTHTQGTWFVQQSNAGFTVKPSKHRIYFKRMK